MADPIAALGLRQAGGAEAATARKTTLGQADFLALMTAQLKNQDPTKPVDNTEYVAQMAQFAAVTGIAGTNDRLDAILTRLDALAPADSPEES